MFKQIRTLLGSNNTMLSGKVELNVSRYLRGGGWHYLNSQFVKAWCEKRESGAPAMTTRIDDPVAAVAEVDRDIGTPGYSGISPLRRLLSVDNENLYYLVRNRVYEDRFIRFKGSILLSVQTLCLLTAMALALLVTCRFRRMYIVLHAVFMGWRGELGLHPKYLLQG